MYKKALATLSLLLVLLVACSDGEPLPEQYLIATVPSMVVTPGDTYTLSTKLTFPSHKYSRLIMNAEPGFYTGSAVTMGWGNQLSSVPLQTIPVFYAVGCSAFNWPDDPAIPGAFSGVLSGLAYRVLTFCHPPGIAIDLATLATAGIASYTMPEPSRYDFFGPASYPSSFVLHFLSNQGGAGTTVNLSRIQIVAFYNDELPGGEVKADVVPFYPSAMFNQQKEETEK